MDTGIEAIFYDPGFGVQGQQCGEMITHRVVAAPVIDPDKTVEGAIGREFDTAAHDALRDHGLVPQEIGAP